MNALLPMPSPPVNVIRLSFPIAVAVPPHLVMVVVVLDCAVASGPRGNPLPIGDLDGEPTWEDAECL